MTTASNINFTSNKKVIVTLFIVFLLSSVGMFGQTKVVAVAEVATPTVAVSTLSQSVALDSDVDFVNWFMGSKQTQSVQEGAQAGSTITSRKKQILSSGVTPNKVLYRTFVKRVISQESAIV